MKTTLIREIVVLVALGCALSAQAAEDARNRFGFSGRFGFDIEASFKNIELPSPGPNSGPATGGANHEYGDGYNRVDSTGNTNNSTWFWGYASEQQLSGNYTVRMSRTNSTPAGLTKGVEDDPQPGFELTYAREVLWDGNYRLGWEGALGWTHVSIKDRATLNGQTTRTVDTYQLLGATPPPSPYAGTFEGTAPGGGDPPRISDVPFRQVETLPGATTTGSREIEAHMFSGRVGPYLEIPFTERFSVLLSGGLALAYVDSDFTFDEVITGLGMETTTQSGRDTTTDWMFGPYGEIKLDYQVTPHVSLFTSAQYHDLGSFSQSAGQKEAKLDMGGSLFVTAGVGFTF
jgi:opacity protein-like surface antigen